MIFDNLSSAVEKVLVGKDRKEQDSLVRFRSWYTFEGRYSIIRPNTKSLIFPTVCDVFIFV